MRVVRKSSVTSLLSLPWTSLPNIIVYSDVALAEISKWILIWWIFLLNNWFEHVNLNQIVHCLTVAAIMIYMRLINRIFNSRLHYFPANSKHDRRSCQLELLFDTYIYSIHVPESNCSRLNRSQLFFSFGLPSISQVDLVMINPMNPLIFSPSVFGFPKPLRVTNKTVKTAQDLGAIRGDPFQYFSTKRHRRFGRSLSIGFMNDSKSLILPSPNQ